MFNNFFLHNKKLYNCILTYVESVLRDFSILIEVCSDSSLRFLHILDSFDSFRGRLLAWLGAKLRR